MKFVRTDKAPAAVGPYSQAVIAGSLVFVSGQIPLEPASGQLVGGSFTDQVRQVLANLDAVLEAAGSGRDRVVKVTVYVTDMSRFGELNGLDESFFGGHRPARAVVQVGALPKGVDVEMDAVAEL
jgi:2-iminobutanoate/2-iminopropanoate deaminase